MTIPHPYPTGGGAQWIGTHSGAWERRENLALAICDKTPAGQLLGAISLRVSLAEQPDIADHQAAPPSRHSTRS